MPLNPGLTTANINIGSVQVENAAGTVINPSTEETSQSIAGLNIPKYDYVSFSYDSSTQTTITFKTGGSGGATVATLVLVYTDSTQNNLSTVTKT